MIKAKIMKVKYFTSDKKTTVCKITAQFIVPGRYGIVDVALGQILAKNHLHMKSIWEREFTGKAVLTEGDAYNEEKGKKIAEAKAKKQLFQFMRRTCQLVGKSIHDEYNKVYEDTIKYNNLICKEEIHIQELGL